MKKQILINLGEGDFEAGFSQTTIKLQKIVGNSQDNLIQLDCPIPQSFLISNAYQTWQTNYDALIEFSRTRTGFTKNKE